MQVLKRSVLTVGILAIAGNAGAFDVGSICCDGGFEYRHPNAWEIEQQRLRDQLAAAQKQNGVLSGRVGDLERQLTDRNREIASVQSSASSTQAELDQSKSRVTELERQLADRDQELASLRTSAGDASQLASQLSAANSEKAALAASLAASQSQVAALQAGTGDKDKLAADLAAANQRITGLEAQLASAQSQGAELGGSKQRVADLERQLADRDRELAGLRGELSAKMAKLNEAQQGLIRALRPEIEQGNITVDLNNERLRINLASSMLFGSGEDQLKPAGVDALKRVGAVLKDYPEYKVEVDGHTDNRPIRSTLKKRFPTNKELSEARAANGVTALSEGGISADLITTAGYADTKPVAPNATDEGRQKNRRVEVRVTPKP